MSTKRMLRGVLDRSALLTGVTHWCEAQMQRGFTALMYHRVLPDAEALQYPFRSLAMPESAFAAQMRWLAEHCTVLPMRECVASLRSGDDLERPLVAVTFDDGYLDNATLAAPLLDEVGLRATFFVTTDFLSTGDPLWFDQFAEAYRELDGETLLGLVRQCLGCEPGQLNDLVSWMAFAKSRTDAERSVLKSVLVDAISSSSRSKSYAPMSLDQLRGLQQRGHEIGAHTLSHPLLPDCDDTSLTAELTDSKHTLEGWLDAPVTGLAYPNGNCDQRVLAETKRAGYEHACTTTPGLNLADTDSLQLARLDVTRDRVFDSKGRFNTLAFRSEVCRVRRFMRAG